MDRGERRSRAGVRGDDVRDVPMLVGGCLDRRGESERPCHGSCRVIAYVVKRRANRTVKYKVRDLLVPTFATNFEHHFGYKMSVFKTCKFVITASPVVRYSGTPYSGSPHHRCRWPDFLLPVCVRRGGDLGKTKPCRKPRMPLAAARRTLMLDARRRL